MFDKRNIFQYHLNSFLKGIDMFHQQEVMNTEDKVYILSDSYREVFTFPDGFFCEEKDENNNIILKWKSNLSQKGNSSAESSSAFVEVIL